MICGITARIRSRFSAPFLPEKRVPGTVGMQMCFCTLFKNPAHRHTILYISFIFFRDKIDMIQRAGAGVEAAAAAGVISDVTSVVEFKRSSLQ